MHITVKPNNFLDYIYDMATFNGAFNPFMASESNYGYSGIDF